MTETLVRYGVPAVRAVLLVRTLLGVSIATASLVAASPVNATVWKNYNNETCCLGASGGHMNNRTNVIVWNRNGNPDQSWTMAGVGGSY